MGNRNLYLGVSDGYTSVHICQSSSQIDIRRVCFSLLLNSYICLSVRIIKNRNTVVPEYHKNGNIQTLAPSFTQKEEGVISLGGLPVLGWLVWESKYLNWWESHLHYLQVVILRQSFNLSFSFPF